MSPRPNILYIHSHDTGRCIQAYGHPVPTPRLQELADEGILFRRCFSMAPTCSPSRAALLTGQAPHSAGMLGLAHLGWSLRDYDQHLQQTLRQAGYHTALAGLQHVAREPNPSTAELVADCLARTGAPSPYTAVTAIGYDTLLNAHGTPGYDKKNSALTAQLAADFINEQEGPFFLNVGFFETHRGFPPLGDPREADGVMPPAPLPDTLPVRTDFARYRRSAADLDRAIGTVLDALERSGKADDTLVIYTTDHGLDMPRMKTTCSDRGCEVALIMRGPGGFSGGQSCDALLSHQDLFPTLCDLLALPRPTWLQGRSFLPVVRGKVTEVNEQVFMEQNFHVTYEPIRAVRGQRYKYLRRFENRTRRVPGHICGAEAGDFYIDHGWVDRPPADEALYDTWLDPQESENRIDDPALATEAEDLRRILQDWMQATDDPLLAGPISAPTGALLIGQDTPRSDKTFQVVVDGALQAGA